jgi:hypothetical protein
VFEKGGAAWATPSAVELGEQDFNTKQVLMVMTKGMDVKTREAVRYRRSRELNVRPWISRVYRSDSGEIHNNAFHSGKRADKLTTAKL